MSTNTCRVCINNQVFLVDIFKKTPFGMISTKLMSITKVHITPEDGLPNTICSKCVQKLEDCIQFIELCETSDVKLRALLDNHCKENKLIRDTADFIVKNDNFISDSDSTLSPRSDTEKVLFIDETVGHNMIEQTTITDNLLENDTLLDSINKINEKINSKKARNQQCFTCGKVMSSRQVNKNKLYFLETKEVALDKT